MQFWSVSRMQLKTENFELGTFTLSTRDPDLQGIVLVLNSLQQYAQASTDILFSYGDLINKIHGLSAAPVAEGSSGAVERT